MTDATAEQLPEPPVKSRKPLIFGVVLAVIAAAGAFYVTWSGMLEQGAESEEVGQALPDIAFVPVDPVAISLPTANGMRQVRFTAQIEVERTHAEEVARLMPRVLDVLNGYLRAIEPADYDEPGALLRIRAQLLRRIQIVTGEGRARDLLVTEFIVQ